MNSNVIPFDYKGTSIRTVEEDGKVLFCGKDVATALGYTNHNKAVGDHCRGVTKRYPISDSLGRIQEARFITEGDLYRLITHSKLETAQQFETWVFDEVLPTIRKHGMYATPTTIENMLADPDSMIKVLEALKAEREQNMQLTAKVNADKPKVLFAYAVAASRTSILIGEMAKILKQNGYDTGQNRFFETLRADGFLIADRRRSDYNMPTQKAAKLELFDIKETTQIRADGHSIIHKTVKVTGKGQIYFLNRYAGGAQ